MNDWMILVQVQVQVMSKFGDAEVDQVFAIGYMDKSSGIDYQEFVSMIPVIKIWFGPPNADFWSVWSSQKAHKFKQIQPTTKVRSLCFEWKCICFQTRDV